MYHQGQSCRAATKRCDIDEVLQEGVFPFLCVDLVSLQVMTWITAQPSNRAMQIVCMWCTV